MSRRDSSPKVTLFPFLAVLVCTMGALILLLVVTTRMIRKQALAELLAAEPAAVAVVEPEPAPAREVPEPTLAEPAVAELPPPLLPVPDSALPLLPQPEAPVEPLPPQPDLAAWERERDEILRQQAEADRQVRRDWEQRLEELREQRKMLLDQLQQRAQSVTRVKTEGQQIREQVARYETVIRESAQQQETISEQLEKLASVSDSLTSRMQLLDSEIERLEQAPPPRPEYQFTTFDALTGTTRRPILIECTANSVIFASEMVEITAEQLSGYTPAYNPLLAGARALTAYWTHHDGPKAPRPYVLLVVRPEGTVGFYVARKMLDQLGEPFGYELVEKDKALRWPDPDAGATEACRKAVERVLQDQVQMQQRLANRKLGLSRDRQFAGSDGNFWLPEVDQLREPDDQVVIGGQTYSRRPPPQAGPARQQLSQIQGDDLKTGAGSGPGADPIPSTPPVPRAVASGEPALLPDMTSATATTATSEGQAGLDPSFMQQLSEAADRARGDAPRTSSSSSPSGSATPARVGLQSLAGAGESGTELPPDIPELLRPHVSASRSGGVAGRSGTIGLERQIRLEILPDKVVVDDQLGVEVLSATTTDQLQHLVGQAIDLQVRGWGASPGGFYWKPYLKIVVRPGGNSNLARLTPLFKHWSLQWTVDHKFN